MRKISSPARALQGLENKVLTAIKFPRTSSFNPAQRQRP
jgi:hypothetical protein